MQFDRKNLSDGELLRLYRNVLLPRMIEEKMLLLLRQGKISKWFSGIGQEAISAGATLAMQESEWIMPLHRNLGVFTSRQIPLRKLFSQWQGSVDGFSKGRERSFHFGSKAFHICGMISHLGPQLAVADGVALAYALKGEKKASLAFTGDGATSEGDFHEALNVAAVWDLPVIFIIENNGYGLSTPVSEQYRCESLIDRAKGYGMAGISIDGNNILTVFDTIQGVRSFCIEHQKPYLIECHTFRMRGHEEASGMKYVPKELLEQWSLKDPLSNYETYLLEQGVLQANSIEQIRAEFMEYIEVELSVEQQPVFPHTESELQDVYCHRPSNPLSIVEPALAGVESLPITEHPSSEGLQEMRFMDAIKQGLFQSMTKDPRLILMGQDIAEYGGAFKMTEGFVQEFGKHRVRNTPLCESAIIGCALGLSLEGFPSVVEMQFADFISVGFNQVVNNLAKIHYRWGEKASTVIRMPTGGNIGAGPFHSQCNEAWFVHTPGLKVVYPSTPQDAKGLMIASIQDPNPVMFFEHKALYRSISGLVPLHYYEVEIGKARVVRTGNDILIITYGLGVQWAAASAARFEHISFYILDLRTLLPLDYEAIRMAVNYCGKVIVLHEDNLTGGIGAEVSAWIGEHCFPQLDAPVMRCASLDTPIPFNRLLERNFLPDARLGGMIERLYNY